jgi:hypothetical protein
LHIRGRSKHTTSTSCQQVFKFLYENDHIEPLGKTRDEGRIAHGSKHCREELSWREGHQEPGQHLLPQRCPAGTERSTWPPRALSLVVSSPPPRLLHFQEAAMQPVDSCLTGVVPQSLSSLGSFHLYLDSGAPPTTTPLAQALRESMQGACTSVCLLPFRCLSPPPPSPLMELLVWPSYRALPAVRSTKLFLFCFVIIII